MNKLKRIEDLEVRQVRRYVDGGRLAREQTLVEGVGWVTTFEDVWLVTVADLQELARELESELVEVMAGRAKASDARYIVNQIDKLLASIEKDYER